MEPTIQQKRATLNPQQRQAVVDLSHNILLLAPAGTGKTNTLSARIANILRKELATPQEILCLSFTNRACREMKDRIERIVGPQSQGVTVRTIHSFGYYLLTTYGKLTGDATSNTSICDEEDSAELVREVLADFVVPEADAAVLIPALTGLFQLVKHEMYWNKSADIAKGLAATFRKQNEVIRTRLCQRAFRFDEAAYAFLQAHSAAVLEKYQQLLRDRGLYDFHDLVLHMGLLLENEPVRELLRKQYRYVHIDEVQDISEVEYDILTRMFPDAVFLLSGDMNQTIYAWRGSAPEAILSKFLRDFSAQQIHLLCNYRSTPGLINLANRFCYSALYRRPEQVPAKEYSEDDVVVAEYDTPDAEIAGIYEQVKALPVESDYSRVAVLCRSNGQCEQIAKGFARLHRTAGTGPRFMLAEEFKLLRTREVKDMMAYLRLLLNREEESALLRVAEQDFGISRTTLSALQKLRKTAGIKLSDFVSPMARQTGDSFAVLQTALAEGNVVVFDVESTGVDTESDQIVQVAAVRINQHAQVLEQYVEYIRPTKSVGSSANVHHITDAFLQKNGKAPAEVLSHLAKLLQGSVVVGHNVGYDLAILETELRRHNLPPALPAGVYDTLSMARRYLPEEKNHKLQTLCQLFETPNQPSHDALEDILATADLLLALNQKFIAPSEEARREAFLQHAPLFTPLFEGLEQLEDAALRLPMHRLCSWIADTFGLCKKYQEEPARLENIRLFLDFLEDPVFQLGGWKQNAALVLEYSTLSSSEMDRLSKASKKMSIITIHQAKGCEFDYVFVPFLTQFTFPNYSSIKSGKVREEARLFYVAITRAKQKLFLSWHKSNGGKEKEASEFFASL